MRSSEIALHANINTTHGVKHVTLLLAAAIRKVTTADQAPAARLSCVHSPPSLHIRGREMVSYQCHLHEAVGVGMGVGTNKLPRPIQTQLTVISPQHMYGAGAYRPYAVCNSQDTGHMAVGVGYYWQTRRPITNLHPACAVWRFIVVQSSVSLLQATSEKTRIIWPSPVH